MVERREEEGRRSGTVAAGGEEKRVVRSVVEQSTRHSELDWAISRGTQIGTIRPLSPIPPISYRAPANSLHPVPPSDCLSEYPYIHDLPSLANIGTPSHAPTETCPPRALFVPRMPLASAAVRQTSTHSLTHFLVVQRLCRTFETIAIAVPRQCL